MAKIRLRMAEFGLPAPYSEDRQKAIERAKKRVTALQSEYTEIFSGESNPVTAAAERAAAVQERDRKNRRYLVFTIRYRRFRL